MRHTWENSFTSVLIASDSPPISTWLPDQLVRTNDSDFSLGNLMRAQIYGVFATLSLGMAVLDEEGVVLDRMFAHGGVFRTAGVAQRFLAASLKVPVSVAETASEGGAWGIAVLAAYSRAVASGDPKTLPDFLTNSVFANAAVTTAERRAPVPR